MENFIVSARKYRPATFESVVGQHAITSTLQNAIRNNTLAQAFLFCGPRGVGKTTCARIMAKTINCLHPTDDMEACNECESCVSFNNNASFNIFELDAASNSGVDDIRALIDQVRIPPQIGKYKVYIIDEVHMLSGAAFNAFLKTLEEPPAYAKFILATTEKHKILPTILSRCQIFDFKRITVEDITQHLKNIAAKEGVQAEEEALNIIAQKADGALRDALSIFDQMVSFSGNNITYQDVITNLNVLDYEYYFRMVDNIMAGDINSMLLLLNEVINKGFDAQNFIQGMASHLRNLLLGKDERVIGLMEVSNQLKDRYMKQAAQCSTQFLLKSLDLANECDINFRSANNKRLHLEIALMKMVDRVEISPLPAVGRNDGTGNVGVKPAAVQPAPQPVAQQPVAPKPQPVQQPQPQQVAQQPQPVAPQPQPQPVQRVRRSGTVSILDETPKEKKAEVREEVRNNPFTQAMLVEAWTKFVTKHKNTSPNFVAGIGKYTPTLGDNFEINYPPIKICLKNQILITAESLKNNIILGDDVKTIYDLAAKFKMDINMIQISAKKISFCITYNEHSCESLFDMLKQSFSIKYNRNTTLETVRHYTPAELKEIFSRDDMLLTQVSRTAAQVVFAMER
ncbi:MAG: DNA polymerase III subunit gamma/tau [Bacteroidales bacterium]|nr:DNA polymerase III subunit gamma/tau [Bacteroidales bacterium]